MGDIPIEKTKAPVSYSRDNYSTQPTTKSKKLVQRGVRKLVEKYTKGAANEAELRKGLRDYGVKPGTRLDKLLKHHEAGTFVFHDKLGANALKEIAKYNPSELAKDINNDFVSKEKIGENLVKFKEIMKHADFAETYIPKIDVRTLHENLPNREIFGRRTYQG